jgi:uncharacterized protein YceH (UPF0502 family)
VRLERRPGQKDARWNHLMGGSPIPAVAAADERPAEPIPSTAADPSEGDGLAEEVRSLRRDVDELRALVGELREALGG